MSLVESVLEMLRAHFPGLEIDPGVEGEPRSRPRREGRTGRGGPRPEPPPERSAARELDPVLARSYAEIGVPYGADLRQVRRAWRRLVRLHHPDLHGADPERQRASVEQMKKLNNAFEELKRRLHGGAKDR
ncbi:MAG TPA: J domain-containing protein [Thermoanaerobaculia bacterium]|jgi:DnaJ-domain-containing protein 1|nr:J domain-containing protein [Thermoanaerobaculia bacterium]